MVENPTDEDWAGVKMALISGRPISFKMDLYNPLYVDRPVVEPELFASLRPATYRGGWGRFGDNGAAAVNKTGEELHHREDPMRPRRGEPNKSGGGKFKSEAKASKPALDSAS